MNYAQLLNTHDNYENYKYSLNGVFDHNQHRAIESLIEWADEHDISPKKLPRAVDEVKTLKTLDLSECSLSYLPEVIGQINWITALYVYNNNLTLLPESIRHLKQLTTLDLSENQLTNLPDWIDELTQLNWLNINHNQLKVLPKTIGNTSRLRFLYAKKNQFNYFPDSICELISLKELDVSWNHLIELPDSIENLVDLEIFHFSEGNNIDILPDSIGKLLKLKKLVVTADVPKWLWNLTSLIELRIYSDFVEIPDAIGKMRSLQVLHIHSSKLRKVSKAIGNLVNLIELSIGGSIENKERFAHLSDEPPYVVQLPWEINKLIKLKRLECVSCNLPLIPFLILTPEMPNLEILSLSSNSLKYFPDSLHKLTSLKELDLSFNEIAEIPESILELTILTKLDFRHNRLTNLPSRLDNNSGFKNITDMTSQRSLP